MRNSGIAWLRCLLLALVFLPLLPATAAGIVVVSDDENTVHQRFIDGFEQRLQDVTGDIAIQYLSLTKLRGDKSTLDRTSLIVTVGEMAAREVSALGLELATLNTLVSKYDHNGSPILSSSSRSSSIYIDQPPLRMLALVKAAVPDVTAVTVGLGESSRRFSTELTDACQALQMKCDIMLMKQTAEIENVMEQAVRSGRVLLVLPDPLVINATTAKSLILGAYMRGIALAGFSQALVKAGALMAVHSTPEQLGEDAANLVREAMKSQTWELPNSRYPRLFSVSVNYQLARALRFKMPSEAVLEQSIRRLERNE